ncbi:hypothetical protein JCM8547_006451 [Rhodosporidiobolus lusitaniae]
MPSPRPSLDALLAPTPSSSSYRPARAYPSGGGRGADDAPELTVRAVVAGLAIGSLLACTNMYFGLMTGWISMMSLQASLLGFAVFKVLPNSPWFFQRPLTIHENIVLQTTAVATGTLPLAAGFVGVLPALSQLSPTLDGSPPLVLSWQALLAWSFGVAFFGVFLAVPLRRQVVVRERLVFPSGTATAQVIGVLHGRPLLSSSGSEGGEGVSEAEGARRRRRRATATDEEVADEESEAMLRRVEDEELGDEQEVELESGRRGKVEAEKVIDRKAWRGLMLSFAFSSGYTLLSLAFPVIYAVPLFDLFVSRAAHDWLWWFPGLAPSFVGQGIIMGFPTVLSMNLGMLTGWLFLSPLSHNLGWAPGPVSSSSDGARGWILWPALAIMTAESILSVSLVAAEAVKPYLVSAKEGRAVFVSAQREESDDEDDEEGGEVRGRERVSKAEEEPSMKIVLAGMAISCVACIVLVAYVFGEEGIKWWATVVALFLASVFAILGVRALGTTDLNPVSAIGKISQLVFAMIQPGNVVANLVAGGIAEAGAQQAGDLMQDLKTGYLWGASPKAQWQGQLIGSFASVFVSTGVYCLYRKVYELPSTSFPVPTAAIWLNLARLVNNGHLPPRSKEAMLVFGPLFVVLAALKAVGKVRAGDKSRAEERRRWGWTRWIPSGIAFSIGFLNTPSFSLARLTGGLISLYYTSRCSSSRSSSKSGAAHLEHFGLVIVASGFVLGEGLASVVGLLAKSAGVGGPVTCWGCGVGGGGYCGGCP